MNVDNINEDVIPTDFSKLDRLDWIFDRQHELMEKYTPIEKHNGLCYTDDCPVNIQDRFGQSRLKDFFWRITEELTEAVQAEIDHPDIKNHKLEELADALHFLVEAMWLADISPLEIVRAQSATDPETADVDKLSLICGIIRSKGLHGVYYPYNVIHELGCASNCLKQRPWKMSHYIVDVGRFKGHMIDAFWSMIQLFMAVDLDADQILRIYFKKSEVNKFRQRSNY